MLKGRKITSLVSLIVATLAFGTFAMAQEAPTINDKKSFEKNERHQRFGREGKRGRHGKRGMRGDRHLRGLKRALGRLELSDAQKLQVKTMLETHKIGSQPLREELRSIHMKKRNGTITDEDKARAKDIIAELKASSGQTKNSIRALLTPEQTQRLEQMRAERKRRMEERRERRQQRRKEM